MARPVSSIRRGELPRPTIATIGPWLGLVVASLLPLLWNRPGSVSADTIDGVLLDPGSAVVRAAGLWDASRSFGALVDRTYSATFPMAPFFWLAQALQVPDWLTQRLWFASLLAIAGAGVVKLLRHQEAHPYAAWAAAACYVWSPYAISVLGTTSVVLVAWAGLPWMIRYTMEAVTSPSGEEWRSPAKLGLVVALVGGGNMSALLYVSVAPLLWLAYALVSTRTLTVRRVAQVSGRIIVCSAGVLAWKVSGLLNRPRSEFALMRSHDPVDLVAAATSPLRSLRGLGEWTFGSLGAYPALDAARAYQDHAVLVLLTLLPAGIALYAIARLRFSNRLYWVALAMTGLALSVGTGPGTRPEAFARILRSITDWDLATPALLPAARALPLVTLSIAVGVGAAVEMLAAWRPEQSPRILGAAVLMAAATVPSLFVGSALDGDARREQIPEYWHDVAAFLDAGGSAGAAYAVLEVPGMIRPEYEWGGMRSPVSFSLVERTVALRLPGAANLPAVDDLLAALDDAVVDGDLDPAAIAPIARLMGVDRIVVRDDTPADAAGAAAWRAAMVNAAGIGAPTGFGPVSDGNSALTVFPVEAPLPMARLGDLSRTIVLDGTASGLVDLANRGLLTGDETIVYAATLDPATFESFADSVPVIVTASSRIVDVGEAGLDPVEEASVPRFPVASVLRSDRSLPLTVPASALPSAVFSGGVTVTANSYGPPGQLAPEFRPANAFDGELDTYWFAGGERGSTPRLRIESLQPVEADGLVLQQPSVAEPITSVRVTPWPLDQVPGTTPPGEVIELVADGTSVDTPRFTVPEGGYRRLDLEFLTDAGEDSRTGVAVAELSVLGRDGAADLITREEVVVPDNLSRLATTADHPLAFLFERWTDRFTDVQVPEKRMVRRFTLDTRRTFEVTAVVKHFDGPPTPDCLDADLLLVDGEPLSMVIDENGFDQDLGAASADRRLELGAGEHVLEVVFDDRCAVYVDSLSLSDGVGPFVGPSRRQATLVVEASADTNAQYALSPTSGVTTPIWLLAGTSFDADWELAASESASNPDDNTIGGPVIVNGFGSGWLLDALPSEGITRVDARWTPQRAVNVSVLASAAGALILVAIVLAPRRQRNAESLAGKEVPRVTESRYVVVLVIVVFGLAAGAVPTLVAGATAVLLERRPMLRSRAALGGPVLLGLAAAGQVAMAMSGAWKDHVVEGTSTALLDALGWSAVAMSVTIALLTAEQSSPRYVPRT